MSGVARFRISGEPRSGLLCRIIGLFAQQDLGAPAMQVSLTAGRMEIEASFDQLERRLAQIIAHKIEGFVGVATVALAPEEVEACYLKGVEAG